MSEGAVRAEAAGTAGQAPAGAPPAPAGGDREAADWIVVTLARLLRDGERVFFGLASPLAMTAALVARATHAPGLVILTIPGGVNPAPGRLPFSTVDSGLQSGSSAATTLAEVFDLSARGGLDTVFLSGVQIDRTGRINMSAIGPYGRPKVRLPGGAGSAMLMPTAKRTILWRGRHDRRSLVESVDFATAAGRVEWVVTPVCVFHRIPAQGDGALRLWSLHPWATEEQVQANTGFTVEWEPGGPRTTPEPAPAEREALDRVDPEGVRFTEFGTGG